jgi:CheY-like chemotaxis protein
MDGREVLEELRRRRELACIPVVALTGTGPRVSEIEALHERVNAVFQKAEGSAEDLLAAVEHHVRRAERECFEIASMGEEG